MQSNCRGGSWWERAYGVYVYTADYTTHLNARGIRAYVNLDTNYQ